MHLERPSALRNYRDATKTLPRHFLSELGVLLLSAVITGCGDKAARAPNPTGYDWPDAFAYRMEYAARTEGGTEAVGRYQETKELKFAVRDDRFVVWHDSVRKVDTWRGAGRSNEGPWPEDTLRYWVRLSRWGEFLAIEPGCDPAETACRDVPPSALPRELRHLIPRLPVWWPPKGYQWEDTLTFDDLPRPRGARGSVTTVYRAPRDTAVGGGSYWIVSWHSVWRAVRSAAGGAIVADPVGEESGAVFVDKQRLIPAFAEWQGSVPPPELRSHSATWAGFRGRAVLVGSAFDSVRVTEEAK